MIDLLRDGPRRAGDLAAAAAMSPPAMSRHLRVLRTSGLVEVESADDDARLRLYRLRADQFVALQAWLDQVQAYWSGVIARRSCSRLSGPTRCLTCENTRRC